MALQMPTGSRFPSVTIPIGSTSSYLLRPGKSAVADRLAIFGFSSVLVSMVISNSLNKETPSNGA